MLKNYGQWDQDTQYQVIKLKTMEHILEILHNLWYGPDVVGLNYGLAPLAIAGIASAGASLLGGIFGGIGKNKRANRAAQEKRRLQNKFDTLMATGASAGGATALANAALRSKRGISADIERQEAQNEQLKAQGQQQLERLQLGEAQRVQAGQFGEAQRLQQADVLGSEFVYGQQERRQTEKMNRVQAQITGAAQQQANYESQAASMFGGSMSTLGGLGMTMINK